VVEIVRFTTDLGTLDSPRSLDHGLCHHVTAVFWVPTYLTNITTTAAGSAYWTLQSSLAKDLTKDRRKGAVP